MRLHLPALAVPALVAAALSLPAGAQYKVVGADGSITYTDRPAPPPGSQVQTLRAGTPVPGGNRAPLPAELRTPAGRFPVTLYTSADCAPCDAARQLLQQRGIPYAERTVGNEDDVAALQRLTGGRTVPALMVGGQALRKAGGCRIDLDPQHAAGAEVVGPQQQLVTGTAGQAEHPGAGLQAGCIAHGLGQGLAGAGVVGGGDGVGRVAAIGPQPQVAPGAGPAALVQQLALPVGGGHAVRPVRRVWPAPSRSAGGRPVRC